MNAIARTAVAIALVTASLAAAAHGRLLAAAPADGAALDHPPTEVRLRFSEPAEPAFTTIRLIGAGAKPVETGPSTIDAKDAKSVVLALPALSAGPYRAEWTMVGTDGHKVRGVVAFTVR